MLTGSELTNFIGTTYDKVTGPLPVVGSAIDLAEDYRKPGKDCHTCVNSLIKWQCTKTASTGFITGLGGLFTLPVSIPTDIAQSLYVQIRMTAAIAHLYGHNIHADQIKTCCLVSLCGNGATEVLSQFGIKLGRTVTTALIKKIPGKILSEINKIVGFRLLTKFGEKGLINLGKMVPVVGGVLGGSINGFGTYTIGKAAKKIFNTKD